VIEKLVAKQEVEEEEELGLIPAKKLKAMRTAKIVELLQLDCAEAKSKPRPTPPPPHKKAAVPGTKAAVAKRRMAERTSQEDLAKQAAKQYFEEHMLAAARPPAQPPPPPRPSRCPGVLEPPPGMWGPPIARPVARTTTTEWF